MKRCGSLTSVLKAKMPSDSLQVHLLHYPIRTLGPGTRIGLWLQGCHRRCNGCIAPKTWDFREDTAVPVSQLSLSICAFWENTEKKPDGLTISGGEPIDQYEPLCSLLGLLRAQGLCDVLLYTGYTVEELERHYQKILPLLTAVVDSPFEQGNPSSAFWRGSRNQNLLILDPACERRYKEWERKRERELQLIKDSNSEMHLIGIPHQADTPMLLNKLNHKLLMGR